MTTGVISLPDSEKIQAAVDLMTDRSISCVIVTKKDDQSIPVGIITERDLVQRVLHEGLDPKKNQIKDVMTPNPIKITTEATLEEGLHMIDTMKIRRLPVVEDEKLVGLVTLTDIVKETKSLQQYNKRLTYHQNVQSYIIIGLFLIAIVAFILRIFAT